MDQLKVQMGAALKATEQAVEQKVALEKETAKGHTLREELMDRIGRDLDGRARVDEGLGTGLAEVKIGTVSCSLSSDHSMRSQTG